MVLTALPPQPHGSLMWLRVRHRLRASQSDCRSMESNSEHGFSSSHGQILWTQRGQVRFCRYTSGLPRRRSPFPVRLMHCSQIHTFSPSRSLSGLLIVTLCDWARAGPSDSLQQRPLKMPIAS